MSSGCNGSNAVFERIVDRQSVEAVRPFPAAMCGQSIDAINISGSIHKHLRQSIKLQLLLYSESTTNHFCEMAWGRQCGIQAQFSDDERFSTDSRYSNYSLGILLKNCEKVTVRHRQLRSGSELLLVGEISERRIIDELLQSLPALSTSTSLLNRSGYDLQYLYY